MKSKHLIIASLLLAIVTIGVVSASEDIASNDTFTTCDIAEDPINETPVDEVIMKDGGSLDDSEVEPANFNVTVKDSIDLEDENSQVVISYTVPEDADGKVNVYVDYMDTPSYSRETVVGQSVNITAAELNIIHPKDYHIRVNYVPNIGDARNLAEHKLKAHVYTEEDFSIVYRNWISSKNYNAVTHFSYPVTGTLVLYVNGTPRCTRDLEELYERVHVYPYDLNITADGIYNISSKFIIKTTSKEITLASDTIEVYGVDWDANEYVTIFPSADILNHGDYVLEIDNDGEYVNGTVSVYIDGILKLTKNILSSDKQIFYDITVDDLGLYDNIELGNHTIKIIYMRDNKEKHEIERTVEFNAEPVFVKYFILSVGEKDALKVTYLKRFNGTATLYNTLIDDSAYPYFMSEGVYKSANFVNGVAEIPFDSLVEGEHVFILNITGYDRENRIHVNVKKNTQGLSASAPSEAIVGNGVVVKFSGPISNEIVNIYLDDEEYKSIPLTDGTVSETITGLSVGTHRIKVFYDDGKNFYSNTFKVTVKKTPPSAPAKKADKITLALKKVKVKKSAKKLVLKATLKINGKKVKGKVIKFKFNKKTYKAKTNKNGVAKVTIKKKILKKLKVGKKVKYQATYGKVTKKYTVKVKK